MTTNNSINQASEILVVGPIGTAADGATLLTVRKDQAANTQLAIINETNNASAQTFLKISQKMNASATLATAGIGFFNDTYAAVPNVAGYAVLQNNLTSNAEPGKGVIVWGFQTGDTVTVAVGNLATTQATWTATGGQYRGFNGNTTPPAGYIGEQIRATNSGVSVSNNTVANLTSVALTAGIWDLNAVGCFSGSLTGTASAISISTANNTLGAAGDARVDSPTVAVSTADYCLVIPQFRVLLSGNATYYLNMLCKFSGGTCTSYGRLSAVRVG